VSTCASNARQRRMHYMTDSSINEQAAFKGAASVRKPWPLPLDQRKMLDEPAYEEIMRQPWRYPQGRIQAEEASLPDLPLPWWENLLIWAFAFALACGFAATVYYIARSLFP
jgi:hypothetical protein